MQFARECRRDGDKKSRGSLSLYKSECLVYFGSLVDCFLSGHGHANVSMRTELRYQFRRSTLLSAPFIFSACALIV